MQLTRPACSLVKCLLSLSLSLSHYSILRNHFDPSGVHYTKGCDFQYANNTRYTHAKRHIQLLSLVVTHALFSATWSCRMNRRESTLFLDRLIQSFTMFDEIQVNKNRFVNT